MKQLLRCCRLHDEQYILHVLGRFFAYRGRKYKPCPQTAASPFPRVIVDDRPTGVRLWIAQATQYLCADAKKRIRAEITAHCQDAQAALMESGLSPEETEARVLEELGDPIQANKAFQKTYLTSAQERYMARVSEFGQTQYQVLRWSILLFCGFALAESVLALVKGLGLFESNPPVFSGFITVNLITLFQTSRGKANDSIERRFVERVKRPLDRMTTWFLFVLFIGAYSILDMRMAPVDRLFCYAVVAVPFLFGIVHRAFIRDLIAWLPNAPRLRTFLLSMYGCMLLSLTIPGSMFFYQAWLLSGDYDFRLNRVPELILLGEAAPIVLGLLWFGGHALAGAFFVSKCKIPQTAPVKREPQEEGPA